MRPATWLVALLVAAGAAQSSRLQIYATVLDEAGDPVRGLQAADLVLRDGGIRQGVVDARAATDPLALAVVVAGLDRAEVVSLAPALRAAVTALRADNPSTQIGLVTNGAVATMIGADPAAIMPTLDALATAPAAPTIVDAMLAGCHVLTAAPPERRVVLAVLGAHHVPDGAEPSQIPAAVTDGRIAIWTVELAPTGPAAWTPPLESALADATRLGGSLRKPVSSPADLPRGIAGVVDDLRAQYVVTYEWPDPMLSTFSLVTRHDAGRVLTPAWSR